MPYHAISKLKLPSYACDPDGIYATVHEDSAGATRVVFVINPGRDDVVARVTVGVDNVWRDVLEDDTTRSEGGVIEVQMRALSVRMLTPAR